MLANLQEGFIVVNIFHLIILMFLQFFRLYLVIYARESSPVAGCHTIPLERADHLITLQVIH